MIAHDERTAPATAGTGSDPRVGVFVSYSRVDLARAQRIVAALEQRGIRCVIDTRDLPYGEKWQNELKAFIRASDTVVFLVSLRSTSSKWCQWELAQVAALSKRLVPVVVQAVPPEQLPGAIGEVHLFPLDDDADFDARIDALAQVLLADRAWIREHTRLGERAGQWLAADRADDHLLTGRALRDAEAWLQRRPSTAPPPSQEQLDYIVAGQARAKRRSRLTVAALSAVVVGALMLSALAWWQRGAAVDVRALAEKQRDRATATAYAARIAQVRSEFDAQRTANGIDILDSLHPVAGEPDARGFEWYALWGRVHDELLSLRPNGAPVSGLAVHPSEPVIATAAAPRRKPAVGARIELWDSRSGEKLGELEGHESGTHTLAFSPDGRWLASGGLNDGSVRLWDWRTRRLERVLAEPSERPTTVHLLRFTADGRGVAASLEPLNCRSDAGSCTLMYFAHRVALLPLREGDALAAPDQHDHRSLAMTAGGPWLGDGSHIFRQQAGAAVIDLKDNDAGVLATSPDGRAVAVGGHTIQILDSADGRLLDTLPTQPGRVTALAYSADGKLLFSGHGGGLLHVWATDNYQRLGAFEGHRDQVLALATAAAAGKVVSASADGSVRVWDVARLHPPAQSAGSALLVAHGSPLAASTDGGSNVGRVVVGSETGLHLFDLELRRDVAAVPAAMERHELLGFAAGGESLWFRDGTTQRLARLAPEGCTAQGALAAASTPAATAASSPAPSLPAGRPLAIARDRPLLLLQVADDTVALRDLQRGTEVARWPSAKLEGALLDAQGQVLVASHGHPARAELHGGPDWASPRQVLGRVSRVVLAPDGRRAVLWPDEDDGTGAKAPQPALLETGAAHRWPLDVARVGEAALSPDGQRLALADDQGTVHLYATPAGAAPQKLAQLRVDLAPVGALAFSADGRRLFSGSEEGRLRIWDAVHGLELGSVDLGLGRILALAPAEQANALGAASFRDDVRSVTWLYAPAPVEVELQQWRVRSADVDRAWARVLAAPGKASAEALQAALEKAGARDARATASAGVRRVLLAQLRAQLDAGQGDAAKAMLTDVDAQALLGAENARHLSSRITGALSLQLGSQAQSLERRAKTFVEERRTDEAERAYAGALAAMQQQRRLTGCLPPRLVEALLDLGVLRYLGGQHAAAAEAWQAAVDAAPDDARPWSNLGFARFEQAQFAQALQAFERAAALDAKVADAVGGMAITLWRLGRAKEAKAAMTRVIAIDERYGRVKDLREAAQWSDAQALAAQELLASMR